MRPNDVGHKSEGPPKNKRISHEGFYPALGRADTGKRTFLFLCITNSAGNWACNPDAQPKTSRAAKKWTTHTHTHIHTRKHKKKCTRGVVDIRSHYAHQRENKPIIKKLLAWQLDTSTSTIVLFLVHLPPSFPCRSGHPLRGAGENRLARERELGTVLAKSIGLLCGACYREVDDDDQDHNDEQDA